jgi:hypothetical protein
MEAPVSRRSAAVIALLVALTGCSSLGEQFGGSVWVTPGKYIYHDCGRLLQTDRGMANRQKELEELMTRAAQGTGGAVIGQAVYRTEYQQVLGERSALAATLSQKRCAIDSPRPSERSVF